jgi:hypothetical protein
MSSDRSRDWLQELLRQYQAHRRARRRGLRPWDSVTTLMLGTMSAALAVVVFAVTLMGFRAGTGSRWHEPRWISGVGKIYLPSPYTVSLGCLGMILGVLGLSLSWRRRKLSWPSAFGVALILLALWVATLYEMIVTMLG